MADLDVDENGDPLQHGSVGWQGDSVGVHYMRGPCVGIVLSTQYSNDISNKAYQMLRGTNTQQTQATFLEATVLLKFGHRQMNIVIENVVIPPAGKTSARSLTEEELPDFSEDIPNGCSPTKLAGFLANRSMASIDALDGDWVLVDFIGGLWDMPFILKWFPHPHNRKDAAKRIHGRRTRIRRNGTEITVDRNGDFTVTHRRGNYFQVVNNAMTLKHVKGQMIHLDNDGKIHVRGHTGHSIRMDEDGLAYTNGSATVEVNGADVRIQTLTGNVQVQADQVNMTGIQINATGGGTPKALVHEDTLAQITSLANELSLLASTLGVFMATATDPGAPLALSIIGTPTTPPVPSLTTINSRLVAPNGPVVTLNADATNGSLRTKVLTGE